MTIGDVSSAVLKSDGTRSMAGSIATPVALRGKQVSTGRQCTGGRECGRE